VKPVRLSPEAVEELADSAAWYESRQPGLAAKFLDEFERTLVLIATRPASFPRLLDMPSDLDTRRAMLPCFPYGVVFLELGTEIRILAVAHAKRQHGYWLDRVVG
jgi:plasmid stabilization system protein ParE